MPLQGRSPDRHGNGLPRALNGRTAVVRLFDAYAALLTARQRSMLRWYYHDDLSLGEIAARAGVTRQAVFDSLRRSVVELRWLEERLGVLADRRRRTRARAAAIRRLTVVEREVTRLANAEARCGDGCAPVTGEQFDLVLFNPPIRAGRRVVLRLLGEAHACLRPGGRLYFVARTQQGARTLGRRMGETYAEVREVARGGGFRVFEGCRV